MDRSVIAAIGAALNADPKNSALRLHLAELHFGAGDFNDVAAHCRVLLEETPDHLEALRLAGRTARATGRISAAEAFEHLVRLLEHEAKASADPQFAATVIGPPVAPAGYPQPPVALQPSFVSPAPGWAPSAPAWSAPAWTPPVPGWTPPAPAWTPSAPAWPPPTADLTSSASIATGDFPVAPLARRALAGTETGDLPMGMRPSQATSTPSPMPVVDTLEPVLRDELDEPEQLGESGRFEAPGRPSHAGFDDEDDGGFDSRGLAPSSDEGEVEVTLDTADELAALGEVEVIPDRPVSFGKIPELPPDPVPPSSELDEYVDDLGTGAELEDGAAAFDPDEPEEPSSADFEEAEVGDVPGGFDDDPADEVREASREPTPAPAFLPPSTSLEALFQLESRDPEDASASDSSDLSRLAEILGDDLDSEFVESLSEAPDEPEEPDEPSFEDDEEDSPSPPEALLANAPPFEGHAPEPGIDSDDLGFDAVALAEPATRGTPSPLGPPAPTSDELDDRGLALPDLPEPDHPAPPPRPAPGGAAHTQSEFEQLAASFFDTSAKPEAPEPAEPDFRIPPAWPVNDGLSLAVALGENEPKQAALGELTPAKVIFGCARSKANGVLRFRQGARAVKLHFRGGQIVAVDARTVGPVFETFLANRGVGNERKVAALPAKVRESPCDLALIVNARSYAQTPALRDAVLDWSKEVLAELSAWETGRCQFTPGTAAAFPLLTPLDRLEAPRHALIEGISGDSLFERLGRLGGDSVELAAVEGLRFEDFRLSPGERSALTRLTKQEPVGLVLAAIDDPDERMVLARMIQLGLETQLVRRVPARVREQAVRAARAREDAVKLAAAPNAYAVLGLPEAAARQVVKERIDQLKLQWAPDPAGETQELVDARAALFAVYEKAISEIGHSYQRSAEGAAAVILRKKPVAAAAATAPEPPPKPPVVPAGPNPDPSLPTPAGEEAIRRQADPAALMAEVEPAAKLGRYSDAIFMIDRALFLGLSPEAGARAKVLRVYFLALAAPASGRFDASRKAIAQIKEIMALKPSADGYLAIGRLAKRLKDPGGAAAAFQQALDIDPKNLEAKTEVNMMSRRGSTTSEVLFERKLAGKAFAALSSLAQKFDKSGDKPTRKANDPKNRFEDALARLYDSEPDTIARAARELGKFGDSDAVEPLTELIGTSNHADVIDAAIKALSELGDVRAIPALRACAARAPVPTARLMAERAIQVIMKKQSGDA
ncbi:MAG: HEAT repeat domain-containing protein [Deltaproteobacteria bacterium]|nr:HEAT repeat domain-containing protein [Deltaproteobacteria bacterium]